MQSQKFLPFSSPSRGHSKFLLLLLPVFFTTLISQAEPCFLACYYTSLQTTSALTHLHKMVYVTWEPLSLLNSRLKPLGQNTVRMNRTSQPIRQGFCPQAGSHVVVPGVLLHVSVFCSSSEGMSPGFRLSFSRFIKGEAAWLDGFSSKREPRGALLHQ